MFGTNTWIIPKCTIGKSTGGQCSQSSFDTQAEVNIPPSISNQIQVVASISKKCPEYFKVT